MEKTYTQKLKLGVFIITGTAIFIAAIYFIGSKQLFFSKTKELNAVFNDANGLQLGNNVRYSGIIVGTVKGITIINDSSICVTMYINKESFNHIKKSAIASIGSDGLVGNMIVNIIPSKGTKELVEPGDTIATVKKIRTEDMINILSNSNSNIALITADLLKITHEIAEGQGTLGVLLNDPVMANDLKETLLYLKITSKEASQTVKKLNVLVSSLDKKDNVVGVIKDTAVANKMKVIVSNLEKSSSEVNKVMSNLNGTISNMKEGKGAINYLSNDPDLVKKIDSTITNINSASLLLNQNLEALKHNFLFRGYFKKQEKKKNKKTNKN